MRVVKPSVAVPIGSSGLVGAAFLGAANASDRTTTDDFWT